MARQSGYRDLIVWNKAMDLVVAVYALTERYPSDEKFGLTAHTRKTAVSIPSNIAEGKRRGSDPQFRQFLLIAFSSGAELETQIEIAKRLQYVGKDAYGTIDVLLDEVMRMLNVIITNVQASR